MGEGDSWGNLAGLGLEMALSLRSSFLQTFLGQALPS